MLVILGSILAIASLVAWVVILIDAFQNEIWKGVVFLICGLYSLYYTFAEFDHEYKWPIVLTYFFGGIVGFVLISSGNGAFAK